MLNLLFRFLFLTRAPYQISGSRSGGNASPRFRPLLEPLGQRILPTAFYWTGADAGNSVDWSDAANWADAFGNPMNTAPGANDSVNFTGNDNVISYVDSGFQQGSAAIASLTISQGYTNQIALQETLTVTNTIQSDGTIVGGATYIVPTGGSYSWNGGTLSGSGGVTQIQSGGTMTCNGSLTLDGWSIENSGSISIGVAGAAITVSDQGKIANSGTLTVGANLTCDLASTSQIVNSGNLTVGAGFTCQVAGASQVVNSGKLTVNAGQALTVSGDNTGLLSSSGTIIVSANAVVTDDITTTIGGSIEFQGGGGTVSFGVGALNTVTFTDGSEIQGPGQVNVFSTLVVTGYTSVQDTTFFAQTGSTVTTNVGATLDVSGVGTLRLGQTTLNGGGTVLVESGVTLRITADFVIDATTLVNSGTGIWSDADLTFNNDGTFKNGNTLSISSQFDLSITGTGTFSNTGTLTKDNADTVTVDTPAVTFLNNGTLCLLMGTFLFSSDWTNSGTILYQGGTLQVNGNFTNTGLINVLGGGDNSVLFAILVTNNGDIEVTSDFSLSILPDPGTGTGGNYTQGSAGILGLQITGPQTNSLLCIGGNASCGGTLNLTLANNYQIGGVNTFIWSLCSYTTVNGQFTINLPDPGQGLFAAPDYGMNALSITWNPPGN